MLFLRLNKLCCYELLHYSTFVFRLFARRTATVEFVLVFQLDLTLFTHCLAIARPIGLHDLAARFDIAYGAHLERRFELLSTRALMRTSAQLPTCVLLTFGMQE